LYNLEGKDTAGGGLESADVWGDEADVSNNNYIHYFCDSKFDVNQQFE
jgi:hypothetical protein